MRTKLQGEGSSGAQKRLFFLPVRAPRVDGDLDDPLAFFLSPQMKKTRHSSCFPALGVPVEGRFRDRN